MRKFVASLVFIFLFALALYAQTPTPKPAEDDDVVKISTTLIQIDVTVTDKNGKIIMDLKPEDFEIYENGEKQPITNFSFISNVKPQATPTPKLKNDPAVPLPPPTQVRSEQVRRTIALVVDDLSLSFQSMHYARNALKKFVNEQMQDGDLVAIIRTGAGIGALQQFTNDKRQLYAAIEKVRWNPMGGGGIGAFAPLESLPPENPALSEEEQREETDREQARENSRNDFRQSLFATGTLGAINYIVRGMQDLPGRKSVMLMSDGFKLFTKSEDGFVESTRVLDSLRRLVDQANRASVVVYTMDARGLQTLGLTAADDTGGRSAEQIEQSMSDRKSELFDTQDGLVYLAKQTGGISIINNNDLSGGIRRMLNDQSYYLIGYEPEDETFDAQTRRFNKLEIKVSRPGARVRYRSGFFGISDEQIVKPDVNLTDGQRISNALVSPFAVNDIAVRLNALFGNTAQQGAFIRSFLHINAQDLTFSDEPDGGKKAVFDVLAIGFGDNGVPVDRISKTYTLTLKKDFYEDFVKNGFVYDFTFPIKKPGAYQLRVALLDKASQKVGSANQFVEVPNLKKDRLTLSGIILENMNLADWQLVSQGKPPTAAGRTNPLSDTALRQFKRGTVLNYGTEVFNAKLDASKKPNLVYQIRVFRDGKLFFEGQQKPVAVSNQTVSTKINVGGSLNLGATMQLGDYVLQIVVTDNSAKEKRKIATQFVQFEIIN